MVGMNTERRRRQAISDLAVGVDRGGKVGLDLESGPLGSAGRARSSGTLFRRPIVVYDACCQTEPSLSLGDIEESIGQFFSPKLRRDRVSRGPSLAGVGRPGSRDGRRMRN